VRRSAAVQGGPRRTRARPLASSKGERQRIQVFEGIRSRKQGCRSPRGRSRFAKNSFGVGVERKSAAHSPKNEKIDGMQIGDVHRASLYYSCAATSGRRLESASSRSRTSSQNPNSEQAPPVTGRLGVSRAPRRARS